MNICSYCQRDFNSSFDFKGKPIYPSLDHIIPLSYYWPNEAYKARAALFRVKDERYVRKGNEISNLLLVCNQCNELKRSFSLLQFKYIAYYCLDRTSRYHQYYINIIKSCDLLINNSFENVETRTINN
mgnify:CR=1 FL=1